MAASFSFFVHFLRETHFFNKYRHVKRRLRQKKSPVTRLLPGFSFTKPFLSYEATNTTPILCQTRNVVGKTTVKKYASRAPRIRIGYLALPLQKSDTREKTK
jgi:hypothetical protein